MKKEKARIEELIKAGGVIQLPREGGMSFTLGGMVWPEAKQAKWSPVFPEHQGHLRFLTITGLELAANGRDVALMDDRGMVAYVTTLEESPLNTDDGRDRWAAWRAAMEEEVNRSYFEDFLLHA